MRMVQVQALRSVEKYLQLEKLYVLGTNCVDNGPREGLGKFLQAASSSPDTVLHYEFMQVHPNTPPHPTPPPPPTPPTPHPHPSPWGFCMGNVSIRLHPHRMFTMFLHSSL